MSLCISYFSKGKALVCADSRVSKTVDGKTYYVGDNFRKIYQYGNKVVFFSGSVHLVEALIKLIKPDDSLDTIVEKAKHIYNIGEDSPERKKSISLCVFSAGDGWPSYHLISSGDGFRIQKYDTDLSKGYAFGANQEKAIDWMLQHNTGGDVAPLIREAFKRCSDEKVGGKLTWYILDENGVVGTSTEILKDSKPLMYWPGEKTQYHATSDGHMRAVNAEFSGDISASTINGGDIYGSFIQGADILGSTIRTAAYGERIVMDPYGFEFFDASNGLRVTLGTNPSANISGHTYYNRYGQSQGLVYAIDDELHVMGTSNLRLGANYGETNMQGNVTFVSRDGVVKFKGVVDFSEATIIGL